MTPSLRPTFVAIALGACLLVGAAACGSGDGGSTAAAQGDGPSDKVTVADATIDWPANPSVAAVRMEVRNGTAHDDVLESVSSPVAKTVSIHRTEEDDEGRSTMIEQPELAVAARSTVTFAPGGLHVMLTGITEDLQVGDDVALTLTFQKAGTVTTTAKVVEPGSVGDESEGSHDH